MYEYWFINLKDGDDEPFDHTGTTYDFLELVCRIAKLFNEDVAGNFITSLVRTFEEQLDFLRINGWEFDYVLVEEDQKIHVKYKVRR